MNHPTAFPARLRAALAYRRSEAQQDRGDVPGWVLITLMSAGLVAVIWAIAEPALAELFDNAIASVTQ
ncbi:hypothetical protein [Demequina sediminicola]|uniref:hypothetical protein n=1 Tax=Demequina sediminicola TaxID=1095026 RepID=UPI0007859ED8|nr:hypothetical protein [Demequina sediminicola]